MVDILGSAAVGLYAVYLVVERVNGGCDLKSERGPNVGGDVLGCLEGEVALLKGPGGKEVEVVMGDGFVDCI